MKPAAILETFTLRTVYLSTTTYCSQYYLPIALNKSLFFFLLHIVSLKPKHPNLYLQIVNFCIFRAMFLSTRVQVCF